MRQGDANRDIARSGLMGRKKLSRLRKTALDHGWLSSAKALPEDAELSAVFEKRPLPVSCVSSPDEHRERVAAWVQAGIAGHRDPRSADAQPWLCRQLLLGPAPAAIHRGEHPAGGHLPPGVRPRRSRPGRLRRWSRNHRRDERGELQDLVLRHDFGLEPPLVRRVRPRPDRGRLAPLPPPCLRMVRRGRGPGHHRQSQSAITWACTRGPEVQRAACMRCSTQSYPIEHCLYCSISALPSLTMACRDGNAKPVLPVPTRNHKQPE